MERTFQESMNNNEEIWKVIYNTLNSIFKNLENSEEILIKLSDTILTQNEFFNVFNPGPAYDISTSEHNSIQDNYYSISVWLLGRIFYLMSYEKFESIQHLFIAMQIRILNILRQNQPVIYGKVCAEYSSSFSQLNRFYYLSKSDPTNDTHKAVLRQFVVEKLWLGGQCFDVSPIFIDIDTADKSQKVMDKLLNVTSQIILNNLETLTLNSTFFQIWRDFMEVLKYSAFSSKYAVFACISKILDRFWSSFSSFPKPFAQDLLKTFSYLEQLTYKVYGEDLVSQEDMQAYDIVVVEMFTVLRRKKITHSAINEILHRISDHLITFHFKLNNPNVELMKALSKYSYQLIKDTGETNGINWSVYLTNLKNNLQIWPTVRSLILNEIKKKFDQDNSREMDVSKLSIIWNNLVLQICECLSEDVKDDECTDLNTAFLRGVLKTALLIRDDLRSWYEEKYRKRRPFVFFSTLRELLVKFLENPKCNFPLDMIHALPFMANRDDLRPQDLNLIFGIIRAQLAKKYPLESKVSAQIIKDINEKCKPLDESDALEIICLISIIVPQNEKYNECMQFAYNLLKFAATESGSTLLKCQVLQCLPLILHRFNNPKTVVSDILLPLLQSSNSDITIQATKSFSDVICVLAGKYAILEKVAESSRVVVGYEIVCFTCRPELCTSTNAEHEVFNRPPFADINKLSIILRCFVSADEQVRRNAVCLLPKLSLHMTSFHTITVTNSWLVFLSDSDVIVRQKLADVIGKLLRSIQENESLKEFFPKVLDLTLERLHTLTKHCMEASDVGLQETVLKTIEEVGLLSVDDVVLPISRLILIFIMCPSSAFSCDAVLCFDKVAKAHDTSPQEIYVEYKKVCCRIIVDLAAVNFCSGQLPLAASLEKVMQAFEESTQEFMKRDSHHILPFLISWVVKLPQIEPLIHEIADMVMLELPALLMGSFPNIYSHAYLNESEDVFTRCMNYVENSTNKSIASLRVCNHQVIHNELLLHYHDKKDKVLEALRVLSNEDSSYGSKSISIGGNRHMAEYLNPRFLGVLVYFDLKLVAKKVAKSVKRRVLQSLPEIIQLMGSKYITPLRFKVLATLHTALSLTDGTFPDLNCIAWDAFIRSCEMESLGPLLSTIFVSLIPLMEIVPMKVNKIFRYLIVDNEINLKEHIHDLYFVLDSEVSKDVKKIIKKHVGRNSPDTFRDKLQMFMKHSSHDNINVRSEGLKRLEVVLKENRTNIEQLVLNSSGLDSILVELIDILISGCRENKESLRNLSVACIGELGAIEPSHLPRRYAKTNLTFTFYMTEDSFVSNALGELARAFQAEKDTKKMDCFALGIQEFLKCFGVSPEKKSPKHVIWAGFSDQMKELMLPLLKSRYIGASVSNKSLLRIHPIYGSHMASTFNEWLFNWTCKLISFLKNDKQPLLQTLSLSLKQDYRTLIFFLPHILVHAILEGDEMEKQQISEEMIAVISSVNKHYDQGSTSSDYSQMKSRVLTPALTTKFLKEGNQIKCSKVVFVLLDFLDRWLREWDFSNLKESKTNYQHINSFLSRFCRYSISKCNYQCKEYPRALMYFEEYAVQNPSKLEENLGFLGSIYAELDEPDGVSGTMALRKTEPSLEELIFSHEISGQLQEAAACYERLAQQGTLRPKLVQGLVRCYLDLDNPYTAINIAEGMKNLNPEYQTLLYEIQAEPLYRLSKFDELTNLLARPELQKSTSWNVHIGQALVHLKNGKREDFQKQLEGARKVLGDLMSIASFEEAAYQQGYPHILKLHILNELQKAEDNIYKIIRSDNQTDRETVISDMVLEWKQRLKVVQSTARVVEPILCLHRIILQQAQSVLSSNGVDLNETLDRHIAKMWLKSTEVARKSRVYQQAFSYALKAEEYNLKELFLEKSQLYWLKEDRELAINTLKRGLEVHFPNAVSYKQLSPSEKTEERKLCAEAKLLYAIYNDETSNVEMDVNISNYKEAVDVCKEWEKSWVYLGQYYDRIISSMPEEDKDVKGGSMQIHIINCFGKSLIFGSDFIYQSMPRMISIWFDFGTRIAHSKDTVDVKAAKNKTLLNMIKLIDTFLDKLPAYIFFTAFSQLISRIGHPKREIFVELRSIMIKLILAYPHHSMWNIMIVMKSTSVAKRKLCQEILQDPRLRSSKTSKLTADYTKLADKLIEICNKQTRDDVQTTTVSAIVKNFPRNFSESDFGQIMMPSQKFRKLVLPGPGCSGDDHDPFPNKLVYIVGIENEIQILPSMQKPKKITLKGSDGKKYIYLLKPKDDLRRDFRLLEFNDVVNQYLRREPEARQRRLYIRTYSVVPMTEDCGLIEWVSNLIGLRNILLAIYKQKGIYVTIRDLKTMTRDVQNPKENLPLKKKIFLEQLLPKHPPVLSLWFRRTFPDAQSWYQARSAYIRTTAVMSMVGYVLGLGDRHGENILYDSTNGDTMHVDFNCLFNKGETFEWPEKVPFRLTHNMVNAMGPLGVEGMFRKSCSITLKVLRNNADVLMSVLTPFIYDHLISWSHRQSSAPNVEVTNDQALQHIQNIELRLKGRISPRGKSLSIALSVEGQTSIVINDAISVDNLSQMYIGWGAYL